MLELLMNLGTFLVTVSMVPMVLEALRNRDDLKGLSASGLLIAITANVCFTMGQAILGIWLAVLFNICIIAANLVILFYVLRCSGRNPVKELIDRRFQRVITEMD